MGDLIFQLPVTKNDDIANKLLLEKVFGNSAEYTDEYNKEKGKVKPKSNVRKHIILFLFIFALVFSNLIDKMVNNNIRDSILFLPGKCVLGLLLFMVCSL